MPSFKFTIVTPISPSPKVPNLNESTTLLVFRYEWMPFLNAPVPFPCTMRTVYNFEIRQSSRYLSIIGTASSTVSPITLSSEFTYCDFDDCFVYE